MPRDLTAYAEKITTKPDLSKPSPEALIWVLENWEESPVANLRFNFADPEPHITCGTAGCAMGTAKVLWGDYRGTDATHDLRISGKSAAIYCAGQHDKLVTAKVVAGRMRDALAGRPIRYLVRGDRG